MEIISDLICFKQQEINQILHKSVNSVKYPFLLMIATCVIYLIYKLYNVYLEKDVKKRINMLIDIFPLFIIFCLALYLYVNTGFEVRVIG